MHTKSPINPPSQHKSYIHVIIDAFSHFVVTVPIKSNNAKTAVKTLLHHWITKPGPPLYLVTDRGSEYINNDMAQLCTLMGIVFHTRPRIPLTFDLKLNQITTKICFFFKLCTQLPEHSHYDKTDINPFFYKTLF